MAQHESILVAMIVNESGNGTKVTHFSLNKVILCGLPWMPEHSWLFILWNIMVSLIE